jgi:hypothetical protein
MRQRIGQLDGVVQEPIDEQDDSQSLIPRMALNPC